MMCLCFNLMAQLCDEQAEFPSRWQTGFQDIIALLSDGEGTADMFCRLLTAVDEDIISLDIPRSAPGMPTLGPYEEQQLSIACIASSTM